MTERQESLHDEILKISDELQLGIRKNDPDWFWVFKKRANMDRVRDMDDLSLDFVLEFGLRHYGINHGLIPYSVEEYLKLDINTYPILFEEQYKDVFKAAQDKHLTDKLVKKHEGVWDATYGCHTICTVIPYDEIREKTAWFYIMRNKSISKKLKRCYQRKPQYNCHAPEYNVDDIDFWFIETNPRDRESKKKLKVRGYKRQRMSRYVEKHRYYEPGVKGCWF
jgi:hypothetical protein